MSQQIVNVGAAANDGTGDTLRASQQKANANFTELYGSKLESVVAGANITVDNTDPLNPIIESTGGGGSQTLADTLILGNTTAGENISISNGDAILLDNGSLLKKGTIDAEFGGSKGIAQICSVGYELKWEAGRLYVMNDGGTTIREVSHNFTTTPADTDDIAKGFVVGSRWILDNGDLYICTDNTSTAAIWELQTIDASPTNGSTKAVSSDGVFDALADKVDKVTGKGLSTNDYTTTEQTKLAGIAAGAEVNVNADWNATSGDAQILNKPTIPSISGLELQSNKQNSLTTDGTGVKYPTVDAVNAGILDINTNAIDRVTVKLSVAINKGQAVYVSGANGTNILVSKASNASESTSSKTIGLLETTGAINDIVNVVTNGLLNGLDTSTATVGDPVWLGTSGNLIYGLASKPYAPAHLVYIGVVTRVSATVGEILINVQNGFELKEIHDVLLTSVSDNDLLIYENSTSLWKNKTITAAMLPTGIDASKIDGGNVSNTEFSYLDGVTSAIQTQIDGKIGITQVTPVTLTTGGWTLVSGLYQYTYSNAAITSASIVDVIPTSASISIVKAADIMPATLSATGTVTIYATNLPTASIVVTFNIFK
jgi:hypothetical protein